MGKRLNLLNQRFGRWTVIDFSGTAEKGRGLWLCKCDCGSVGIRKTSDLTSGASRSCGCLRRDNFLKYAITHGMSDTRLYNIWSHIIQRCTNPNNDRWGDYGGRGITVCEEWKDFKQFAEWALANGYSDNLSIDRKNNDDGYKPSNCRWADQKTQMNNRRANRFITYNGKTQTITEWSRELSISRDALQTRMRRGWPIKRALETPVQERRREIV